MGLNKPFQGTNLDEIDPGNNPADRVLRPVDLFLEDEKAPRLLAFAARKPNWIRSPYDRKILNAAILDAMRISPGGIAKDPDSGRLMRLPR
jgi:hypothetical protein